MLGTEPAADGRRVLSEERLEDVLQKKLLPYDKAGEEHFNLISALHKSVRNSDPDAALYWLARMLESGEDPLYIARRMVRMASEDIGLAEPGALAVTHRREGSVRFHRTARGKPGAGAGRGLSCRSRRNRTRCTPATARCSEDLQRTIAEPVPLHLRNAVTGLMGNLGYGKGYQYAHDAEEKVTDMTCLPESLAGRALLQNRRIRDSKRASGSGMEEIRRIKKKSRRKKTSDAS